MVDQVLEFCVDQGGLREHDREGEMTLSGRLE